MGRLWEPFYNTPRFQLSFPTPRTPAVDIKEDDKAILVSAELPGMKLENIKVEVHDNVLTLRGEHSTEKRSDTDRYHLSERTFGSFERSFSLPENVDTDHIDASYKDGVLNLSIPKRLPAQPRTKQIEIKAE